MKFISNLETVINEIKRGGKIPVYVETVEGSGNSSEKFLTVRNGNLFGYKSILINPALLNISLPPLNINDYTTGNMPAILTKQDLMSSKYYPLNVSISDSGNLSLTHRNDDFVERYIGLYCSPFLYRACCYTPTDEKDGKFISAHRDEILGDRSRSNLIGETGREIEIQMSDGWCLYFNKCDNSFSFHKYPISVEEKKREAEGYVWHKSKNPTDLEKFVIPMRAFLYYVGLSYGIDARVYNKVDARVIANLPEHKFYIADIPSFIAQSK